MAAAALVLLVTLMFMIGAPRPHKSLQPWALAIVNLGSLMVGVGAPLGVWLISQRSVCWNIRSCIEPVVWE
jgi:hypothetical protein